MAAQDSRQSGLVEEARARQAEIVQHIRDDGFKDGGERFTDAQIWQAAVDAQSANPYVVTAHLLTHVIEGRSIPSSPTYGSTGE